MMGRLETDQEQLFYSYRLDELVPADHLVRKLDAVLDLSWVQAELAPFYSHTGRPSIEPEVMLRMLLVGYVFANVLQRHHTEGSAPTAERTVNPAGTSPARRSTSTAARCSSGYCRHDQCADQNQTY